MAFAKTVIIGGGAIGLSVAYHLGKLGVPDVVLLERNQLTSGTSWHAAGIVGPLRSSKNLTELARYAIKLFADLEHETGQHTGYRETGGILLAQEPQRINELERIAAMGRMHALDTKSLSPSEIGQQFPFLRTDDLAGAIWVKQDGQVNPVDLCMAYAKGARRNGIEIREQTGVANLHYAGDRISMVELEDGELIEARVVINCAGLWAREVGLMAGVSVPVRAVEHIYVVTEPVQDLPDPCPIVRDLDSGIYIKGDTGKLVLGAFEGNARIWEPSGVDKNDCYLMFEEDWEHVEPMLTAGINRVPQFAELGITQFMNGPESFTPDTRQIMGRAPGFQNFYVAAGFNSIGIMSSAGVGKVMADWVLKEHPPMDLWEVDIMRFDTVDNQLDFLDQRIPEAVHNQFHMHWPFKQYNSGRDRKCSVWHQILSDHGAVFGAPTGWERPLWFARSADEKKFEYSYGPQCWWPMAGWEAKQLMHAGAVFELSPFSKFLITGDLACSRLQNLCTNRIDRSIGSVVYSLMLNPRGGIEAECTLTRIAENCFLVVTGAATRVKDFFWMQEYLGDEVAIKDITDDYAALGVMGPRSAQLMHEMTKEDFEISQFPFLTSRMLQFGSAEVRVNRVSYVGEKGWELFIPISAALSVIEEIVQHMTKLEMTFAGHFCLDSCRLEKGYAHWGHDIGPDDNPIEAGLMFAVELSGDFDFIGKETLRNLSLTKSGNRRVLLEVEHPEPLLLHDEPVIYNGQWVGRTTSGGLGFRTHKALSMAYIDTDEADVAGQFNIEVAGKLLPARILDRPPYDPAGLKMRND
jgi:4-methylaminobutanoate oxidase (formaldehyde-forming)